jgi:hypothetical protein
MIIDVTHLTRFQGDDTWRIHSRLDDLVHWLDENVGEAYGRGEGDVWRVGHGWEIVAKKIGDGFDDYQIVNIVLDINDGPKATWAAMMWGTK